jgi:hypothetical protein
MEIPLLCAHVQFSIIQKYEERTLDYLLNIVQVPPGGAAHTRRERSSGIFLVAPVCLKKEIYDCTTIVPVIDG